MERFLDNISIYKKEAEMKKNPVVLIIRDGWGYRRSSKSNAIKSNPTPNTDKLSEKYPHILLDASGGAVGLPDGYMGNSEVGHLTIGSGRIINQSLVRINKSIDDGGFFSNNSFLKAIENCKNNDSTMHLVGLIQKEGVHSLSSHLFSLLDMCKENGLFKVCVHAITDGRDAPPTAGKDKLDALQKKLNELGIGEIATISGRYYAMDRDKRWKRTKQAYKAIVNGIAPEIVPLSECYGHDETDEFLIPRKKDWYQGFQDKDSAIFFNFRTDRTRQLTKAIVEENFKGFKRDKRNVFFVAMTRYYKAIPTEVAFDEILIKNHLGEALSKAGKKQLRISETEKYAHVTFFFNGQQETPFEGENRMLIPSPKVATYDKKPEMSAYEITDHVLKAIDKDIYDVIIMNIVNGDMVGHTGVLKACDKAVKVVDECLGEIIKKTLDADGTALVFADHGNIEDQTPEWRTSHTCNPVPFILISNDDKIKLRKTGGLADIAPTTLDLLGIEKPQEMTGKSLLKK